MSPASPELAPADPGPPALAVEDTGLPGAPIASTDGDADGDGHPAGADCDDADPAVHPGAFERPYDGVDQDCDGLDETDVDDDGHAAEVVGGDDCDDVDRTVHGGAVEVCGNLRDDDCDGRIDGGCPGVGAEEPGPGGLWWACDVARWPPTALGWILALVLLWRRRAAPLRR